MKRWKRKPRASAWNNKAFVTSCRTSGVRKMAQCAPPPGTSTVFLRPQWLQHKLKSSQKVSKYPRLERERPCPSRCANEELHLHQCVGGYSSGATYSRWFCRCTCPKPHFLQMLVAVAVSISQAALGWYGDCDGSRHLPREAAADHARESLSLLGMSQLCHANPWNANCSPFSQQKLWNASHLPKGRAATNKSIEIAAGMADHHLLLNTSCAKM